MEGGIYKVIMDMQREMVLEQSKNDFVPVARMLKGAEVALLEEGFSKDEAFILVESMLKTILGNLL